MTLQDLRRKLNDMKAMKRTLISQYTAEVGKAVQLAADLEDLEKARVVFQEAAKRTQENLRFRITSIGTTALRTVFREKTLSLEATFETKRNRTECSLEVMENQIPSDILESRGGGVADVLSLALRTSFWAIDKSRAVLIMDEPCKYLHDPTQASRAAEVVRTLSKELGIQFIIVTDKPEFASVADKVFRVSMTKGISKVEDANAREQKHHGTFPGKIRPRTLKSARRP